MDPAAILPNQAQLTSFRDGIARLVADLRTRYGLDGKREEKTVPRLHRQYALAFG